MAQHTCSPSRVVIGVAAREQDGEVDAGAPVVDAVDLQEPGVVGGRC